MIVSLCTFYCHFRQSLRRIGMASFRAIFVAVILMMLLPSAAAAQVANKEKIQPFQMQFCGLGEEITPACQKEYDTWLFEEMLWRKVWTPNNPNEKLIRRVNPQWLHSPVLVFRPEPPVWLQLYCAAEMSYQIKSPMCQAYDEALRYDLVNHLDNTWSSKTYSTSLPIKIGEKNGFLQSLLSHTHFDSVLWDGSVQFAFGGTHLELVRMGRLGIWVVPGVIFFREWNGTIVMKMTEGADVYIRNIPIGRYSLPAYFTMATVLDPNEAKARNNGLETGTVVVGLSFTIIK